MSLSTGRQILTQAQLQKHRTTVGNVQDVIWAPLFDSASYPTAGQTQLVFYTAPIGQGTTSAPGGSGSKTIADTNLNSAGLLPKGNEFYMTGQELEFFPGALPEQVGAAALINGHVNDVYNVSKSGVLTLSVGSNRTYIQDGPIGRFPPAVRLAVAAAVGGTDTAGTQSIIEVAYAAMVGQSYAITPIYIEATQGFQETLNWPAAVTISATGRIYSRMCGYLIRNAQ